MAALPWYCILLPFYAGLQIISATKLAFGSVYHVASFLSTNFYIVHMYKSTEICDKTPKYGFENYFSSTSL